MAELLASLANKDVYQLIVTLTEAVLLLYLGGYHAYVFNLVDLPQSKYHDSLDTLRSVDKRLAELNMVDNQNRIFLFVSRD